MIRAIITSVGFVAAVFFSPWIAAVCIVLLAVRYRALEAILIGATLDLLWLPFDTFLLSFPVCTLMAALLVWGFEPLRREFLTSDRS